jgi:hypothetical protein
LTAALLLLQVAIAVLVFGAYAATGLSYDWLAGADFLVLPACLLIGWGYYLAQPGRQRSDWITAESCLVLAMVLVMMVLCPPGQYAMVALGRPLVDPWLEAVDGFFGIYVPDLVTWTRAHPSLANILLRGYLTLSWQLFVPVLLLGFWYRRREDLWEYVWHFHVVSLVVLVVLALWPAEGPPLYYEGKMEPLFNFSRYAPQFRAMYTHSVTVVNPSDLDGLVSMPSFHAAAAVMVVWAMRFSRLWMTILIPINVALLAATILSGAHYAVDLAGTALMLGVSLVLWRRVARHWLSASPLSNFAERIQ